MEMLWREEGWLRVWQRRLQRGGRNKQEGVGVGPIYLILGKGKWSGRGDIVIMEGDTRRSRDIEVNYIKCYTPGSMNEIL